MTDFRTLIMEAQAGSEEATEKILLIYEPLINKYSRNCGCVDEDMRQFIIMRILIEVNKFCI